jgi:hypothetical protein
MTPIDIIRQVQEHSSEWLEMTDNPDAIVSIILANKLLQLTEYIEFLEKRVHHVSMS